MDGARSADARSVDRVIFVLGIAAFVIAIVTGAAVAVLDWSRVPYGSLNYLSIVRDLRVAGEVDTAIRELEAEQRINAADTQGSLILATLLSQTGQPGALEVLARASARTVSPDVHLQYARKASQLGRFDQADLAILRAITFAPDSIDLWLTVADIREKSLKHDEARAAFAKALEIDPSSAPAQRGLQRLGTAASGSQEGSR